MDSKTTNIELKKISETEYLVGRNLTQLIHGNIIYVNAVGEQTAELAELQNKINMTLATASNGKINYLIDLNKCGKNSPEAKVSWSFRYPFKSSRWKARLDASVLPSLTPAMRLKVRPIAPSTFMRS